MRLQFAQFVSRLGREILTTENFHALLPEALERVGLHFQAAFAGCYLSNGHEQHEVRWDRHVPDSRRFDARPWLRDIVPAGLNLRHVEAREAEGIRLQQAGLQRASIASIAIANDQALHVVVAQDDGADQPVDGGELSAVTSTLALGASRFDLQQLAVYDPCTGLYNRRYMDGALTTELQRAKRFRMAMSLMILDLDHFKEVNDQFGHLTGDRVLAQAGRVLHESVRTCDIVVRYGGDEFILILPATSLGGARHVARRIRSRIKKLKVGSGSRAIQLSFSGGVAAVHTRSTERSLLDAADRRLYRAKGAGRNRIVFPNKNAAELSPQLNLLAVSSAPRSAMGPSVGRASQASG